MFFQNSLLRHLAIAGYRSYARSVFWLPAPKIFVNSFPKAGTHLLTAILNEFPSVMNSGRFIWTRQVHSGGDLQWAGRDFVLDEGRLRAALGSIRNGQYTTAHLPWRPGLVDVLSSSGFAPVYMMRDPRDVLVSRVHYIVGLRRHRLHTRFITELPTAESRLMACIEGLASRAGDRGIEPIDEFLAQMDGWRNADGVLVVRFEDLIGARGGGSDSRRAEVLSRLAQHIGRPLDHSAIDSLGERICEKRSFTFRKGLIGDWRNHFTAEHKEAFKRRAGDVLTRLGYEDGLNW